MASNDIKAMEIGAEGKPAGRIVAEDEKAWKKEYRANKADLRKHLRGDQNRNWDYGYILEYLRLKLRCMRSHFTRPDIDIYDNSFVKQIDEALAAIGRYDDDGYYDAANAFHCKHAKIIFFDPSGGSRNKIALSYEEQLTGGLDDGTRKFIDDNHLSAFRTEWDSDGSEREWLRMMGEADEAKRDDLRLFFRIMGDHIEEWWD